MDYSAVVKCSFPGQSHIIFIIAVHLALVTRQSSADSPSPLMIGPPPMIIDDIDANCWNFTYGNWRIQEFYTPNYPGEYLNNTDCVLYLEAPIGFKIQLDFRDKFILEKSDGCKYDFLEVRDGPFAYSPLISRYCNAEFPPIIMSTGRFLWMRFKTDDLLQYGGFRAVYSYHKDHTQNDGADVSKAFSSACRILVKLAYDEADGLLSSDDVPFEVDKDPSVAKGQILDCTWEIYTEKGYQINLRSSELELKNRKRCDMNNITIYERTTLDSAAKEEYCRGNHEVVDMTSDSNRVFVRLYGISLSNKPSVKIIYTLVRKGDCSEMEFRCGDVCLPASLLCNGVDNCRDRSDEKGCTNTKPAKTKPYIGGSRKDNVGDAGKRRSGGGYADKDDDSAHDSNVVPLYVIILGAVGGVIVTCVSISLCVMCRLRKRDRANKQEAPQQKFQQRNALEMAVSNSSNTSMSLSRQNNEGQGLQQSKGSDSDRQHYVTFSKVNTVQPTITKDESRYNITDLGLMTSSGEGVHDHMTESGNYKRFLTMDVTPDDVMGGSTHQHLQDMYPSSPGGVMGMTNLDHRSQDAFHNFYGNQWQPTLKDDTLAYPYGTTALTRPTPFLGLSKAFPYSQPESKFESKYLKALRAKESEPIKEYPDS